MSGAGAPPAEEQDARMYGLSQDGNLSFLIGKEICQAAIGPYDVQFNWGSGGMSVWHRFVYTPATSTDAIEWVGDDPVSGPQAACNAVRLLRVSIAAVRCTEKGSLELKFSNGDKLEVFEDERYESFSIRDGKRPEILV
jgi:uncharacterized protein DUF6188